MRLQRMILLAELDEVVARSPMKEAKELLDKFRL
jgi:hypothetical protein